MKPILKWVGGKRRFLSRIKPYIPDDYNKYIEPFFGSGALFFNLEPKESIINDLNEDLMNFYEAIKSKPQILHDEINKKFWKNRNEYYDFRDKYNSDFFNDIEKSAAFFYLNKFGFNGIYRVNANGKFNVPIGSNESPYCPKLEEFNEAAELLKTSEIYKEDFEMIINKAQSGDLVYLDPPYFPDESSKFVGYTDPIFNEAAHQKLVNLSFEAHKRGATVIISNSDSKKFKKMVDDKFGKGNYKRIIMSVTRTINPNSINKNRFIETLYVFNQERD